jgi:hypothetical protein
MNTTPADLLELGQAFCLIVLRIRKEIIFILNFGTLGFSELG